MLKDNKNNFDNLNDACGFDDKNPSCPNKKLIVGIIIVFALILSIYYLFSKSTPSEIEEVIIISAEEDENDNKEQPMDPGGMVVSNVDKDIYDTIDKNSKRKDDVQVLLTPTEEPVNKSELLSQDEPEQKTTEVTSKKEPKEEFIKPVAQNKNIKHKKFAKQTDQSYRVQIASFKSKKDSEKQWKLLSKKYSKLLSGYEHYIVSKDIEGKGIFQRLQVGPFENKRAAKNACSEFKDHGLNCFVIKP